MKSIKLLTAAAVILSVMTGCRSHDQLTYFKNLPAGQQDVIMTLGDTDYSLKIVPDDELLITVTSLSPEATAMYNLPMVNVAGKGERQVTGNVAMQTYIVDKDGDIRFPMLGKIHVGGMTTNQLTDFLIEKLSADVDEPMVRVDIVNFVVNVLGEVQKPGRYPVNAESVTILDALAMANDMTEYGRRDNVLLIRREGDKTTYHRFNLQDVESLNSPYFFLKQNDVVYVDAEEARASNARYDTNNSYKLSVVSTIVSTVSVIASLVIALTR